MNKTYTFLAENYNFSNYKLSSHSISFIAHLDSSHYLHIKIDNHPAYNTETIYFLPFQTENNTTTPILDDNLNILRKRYTHLTKNSQSIPPFAQPQQLTQSPISLFALDSSGYFYIHPCQNKNFSQSKFEHLQLQLATLGIY